MGERRLELVEECKHGRTEKHAWHNLGVDPYWHEPNRCPGGSRRVLSEPTEEMVDAATAEMAMRTGRDIFVSDMRAALGAALAGKESDDG